MSIWKTKLLKHLSKFTITKSFLTKKLMEFHHLSELNLWHKLLDVMHTLRPEKLFQKSAFSLEQDNMKISLKNLKTAKHTF